MDKTYNELINKLIEYAKLSTKDDPERFVAVYLLEHKEVDHKEMLLDLKDRIRAIYQYQAA